MDRVSELYHVNRIFKVFSQRPSFEIICQDEPAEVGMVQIFHPEQLVNFPFVEFVRAPDIGNGFYFGVVAVEVAFDHQVMPVFCGGKMVHHGKMGFPVNTGVAEKEIEKPRRVVA